MLIRVLEDLVVVFFAGLAFFRLLGQRWLENCFAKKLQDHKAKIDSLFSRISKIHQKEFEVLPEAWRRLHQVLGLLQAATATLYEADLDRMTPTQLDEFLDKTELTKDEKAKLLTTMNKKTELYIEFSFWHDVHKARSARSDFHNYLLLNKIFLSSDLFDRFSRIDQLLARTVSEQEIGKGARDYTMLTHYHIETKDKLDILMREIEELVQKRLHYPEA